MSRSKLPEEKKSVQITITIDQETNKKLEEYMKLEDLPRSRMIARILKRYFEMK